MLLMLSLLTSLALADDAPDVDCPVEARVDVLAAASDLEQAWLSLDGPGFDVARNRMSRLMPCTEAPFDAADAALLHRARALVAFVDGDMEASQRSFAAVHALQPEWHPDPALVPREHPLWRVFESAVDDDEDPKMLPFRLLPQSAWVVDGTRFPRDGDPRDADGVPTGSYGLPADRAFVLQLYGDKGGLVYTAYHLSTADLPVNLLKVAEDPDAMRRRRKRVRVWGSVVGGALLAAGATSFGLAWKDREAVAAEQVDLVDLEPTQRRANALGVVGYSLGGVGAATFTLAWAVPW